MYYVLVSIDTSYSKLYLILRERAELLKSLLILLGRLYLCSFVGRLLIRWLTSPATLHRTPPCCTSRATGSRIDLIFIVVFSHKVSFRIRNRPTLKYTVTTNNRLTLKYTVTSQSDKIKECHCSHKIKYVQGIGRRILIQSIDEEVSTYSGHRGGCYMKYLSTYSGHGGVVR